MVNKTTIIGSGSSGTATMDTWNPPVLVQTSEVGESIELTYRESSNMAYTTFPPQYPPDRVFKIIYSCVAGKWNKSERIYGKIIPEQSEYFEFDHSI